MCKVFMVVVVFYVFALILVSLATIPYTTHLDMCIIFTQSKACHGHSQKVG